MPKHRLVWLTIVDQDPSPLEAQLSGLDYELEFVRSPDPETTVQAVRDADVVVAVGVPLRTEVLGQAGRLQAILSQGHGFDHIDIDDATRQGIMVVNTPGFCTEEVSNHALALLLACTRQIVSLDRRVRNGEWTPNLWGRIDPISPLVGQVLGLVSFGGIARLFARKARALGLKVIAYDPYIPPWIAQEYRIELVPDLNELARRSDFVSTHVPSDASTRGMLGEAFFRAMKPSAFLRQHGPGADRRRGGPDFGAPGRTDRRRGSGRFRGGTALLGQPADGDGKRGPDPALGRAFRSDLESWRHDHGAGSGPHLQGGVAHVPGQPQGPGSVGSPPAGHQRLI